MNQFSTTITLYSNKFELNINIDALNTAANLNIGSKAKVAITQEMRRLTGKSINTSAFKSHIELINKKLEEYGLNIDVYVGTGKSKKKLLTATYAGKQIMRERKLEEIING
jgi:hypothetical protein